MSQYDFHISSFLHVFKDSDFPLTNYCLASILLSDYEEIADGKAAAEATNLKTTAITRFQWRKIVERAVTIKRFDYV